MPLLRLEQFSWVAFTSPNAVAATLARADRRGVRRRFARIRVAGRWSCHQQPASRAELDRPANLVPDRKRRGRPR